MRSHGLDGIFHRVINSSELGLAKPAHDYFNEALNRLGVRFDEVIYIDDTVINVESAILLGIRSHHYQNHTQLMEFLVNTQKIYLLNIRLGSNCRTTPIAPDFAALRSNAG
jgi:FMN phosphatase YigB (HAD superfamily)